jgi:hypothetical protein
MQLETDLIGFAKGKSYKWGSIRGPEVGEETRSGTGGTNEKAGEPKYIGSKLHVCIAAYVLRMFPNPQLPPGLHSCDRQIRQASKLGSSLSITNYCT